MVCMTFATDLTPGIDRTRTVAEVVKALNRVDNGSPLEIRLTYYTIRDDDTPTSPPLPAELFKQQAESIDRGAFFLPLQH